MSEAGNGEEAIDDEGRNQTQQRLDREGAEDRPADVTWEDGAEGDEG
jgi:hypothetical protein